MNANKRKYIFVLFFDAGRLGKAWLANIKETTTPYPELRLSKHRKQVEIAEQQRKQEETRKTALEGGDDN